MKKIKYIESLFSPPLYIFLILFTAEAFWKQFKTKIAILLFYKILDKYFQNKRAEINQYQSRIDTSATTLRLAFDKFKFQDCVARPWKELGSNSTICWYLEGKSSHAHTLLREHTIFIGYHSDDGSNPNGLQCTERKRKTWKPNSCTSHRTSTEP